MDVRSLGAYSRRMHAGGGGITEKGEGHTKLPVDQRVIYPCQRWSRWFLCTTEQRRLMHAHLAHRPSPWALELKKQTHTVFTALNITTVMGSHARSRGSPRSQVELIQSVLFCSVLCCVNIIQNIIHTVWVHWFDYSPWSHSHKLKMTTWLCRTQAHHDGKSKITVYVASSFLSAASSETWSPVVGSILILLVRVFVCNYVLILPQVGVLCKALCSTVHPHTFKHGDVTWENVHFWLT